MINTAMLERHEEQHQDIAEWLDALGTIGIDTSKALPEVWAARRRVRDLRDHLERFRDDATANADATAAKLAADPGDYDAAIDAALAAATAGTEGVRGAVTDILTSAVAGALRDEWLAMRAGRDVLLDQLRAEHDDIIAAAIANTIHLGINTADLAGRSGVSEQWFELERLHARWNNIHTMVAEWHFAGLFPRAGTARRRDFLLADMRWRRPAQATAVPKAHGAPGVWLAHAAAVGEPAVLTEVEAVALASTTPDEGGPTDSDRAQAKRMGQLPESVYEDRQRRALAEQMKALTAEAEQLAAARPVSNRARGRVTFAG